MDEELEELQGRVAELNKQIIKLERENKALRKSLVMVRELYTRPAVNYRYQKPPSIVYSPEAIKQIRKDAAHEKRLTKRLKQYTQEQGD